MSWTDIFPMLSDEMLDAYRAGVSEKERGQYEEWLGVERIVPAASRKVQSPEGMGKSKPHVVSATLFWKHVNGADPELPVPTRERLVMAKRLGLVKRFSPWESYVEPLIRSRSLHLAHRARHPAGNGQPANLPRRGPVPIHRVAWPDYGYDEWFQLAALYPRMVPRGTLTFLPADAQSLLLPVDIEYVTWANRRSEIVYF